MVYLVDNQIGVEGAIMLADAIKVNTSLREIYLWHNQFGCEGAKHLAIALKDNQNLTKISLRNNQIGDEGATCLADALMHNKSLEIMYLSYNEIGDKMVLKNWRMLSNVTTASDRLHWNGILSVRSQPTPRDFEFSRARSLQKRMAKLHTKTMKSKVKMKLWREKMK